MPIITWQPLNQKPRYTPGRFLMKGKTNILIFFIIIVLIAVVAGFLVWNKPHQEVRDAKAIKITAIGLYKIFVTDSARGNSAYINKVVAVTGEVKQVLLNQQHQQIILLNTGTPGASVNCTMEENANNIKTGDTILLKGICSGYLGGDIDMELPGDVFLIRCYPSK